MSSVPVVVLWTKARSSSTLGRLLCNPSHIHTHHLPMMSYGPCCLAHLFSLSITYLLVLVIRQTTRLCLRALHNHVDVPLGSVEGLEGGGLGGQELALTGWVLDWGRDWGGKALVCSGTGGMFGSRQGEWALCIGTWINWLFFMYFTASYQTHSLLLFLFSDNCTPAVHWYLD